MRHTVEDISFGEGWVECACGTEVAGDTPDKLAIAFREHRRAAGESRETTHVLRGKEFVIKADHHQRASYHQDPVVAYLFDMEPIG